MCERPGNSAGSKDPIELISDLYPWVFAIVKQHIKNWDDALEVVQTIYIELHRRKDRIDLAYGSASVKKYVGQFISWTIISWLRKRRRRASLAPIDSAIEPASCPANEPGPLDESFRKNIQNIVRETILEIEDDLRRRVVWLFNINGYSHLEIAELLDITVTQSEKANFHGKQDLKKILRSQYGDDVLAELLD